MKGARPLLLNMMWISKLEAVCGTSFALSGLFRRNLFPGAYAPGFILAPLRGL
jgi:hypothetical protein